MEKIGEHSRGGPRANQPFDLERLYVGRPEMLRLCIEQPTVGTADAIRTQRLFQIIGLEQNA